MSDTTLICTVTASGPEDPLALPTDGLCDFVFYESLYAGQTKPDTLIDDVPSPRLKSFMDAASTSVLTDYGCAVDINYHREFATDLEDPKGKNRIVELWNQNVFHYGFLTLDQYRSGSADVMAALNNLKAVTSAVREATGGEALTALGLFIKLGDVSACANVSYFVKTIFTPTALVVLAHISYQDNAFNTCRIIPPMMYQVPLKYLAVMKYGHAFCVKKNLGAQRTTSLAISVSLKGRRYKPLSPDTDPNIIGTFDLFNYCSGDSSYDQTAPSAQLCELTGSYKQHLTYNTAYQAVVTYDKTEGFTIIFENEDSIRKKVCDAAGAYPLKPFSLAAYDVNFDAGVSSCPSPGAKGDFSRLRIVRGLIQYVLDPPKATTACEAVS